MFSPRSLFGFDSMPAHKSLCGQAITRHKYKNMLKYASTHTNNPMSTPSKQHNFFRNSSGTIALGLLMLLTIAGISSAVFPAQASIRPVEVASVSVDRTISMDALSSAIQQRKELLKRRAILSLRTASGSPVVGTWGVMLSDHPSWLEYATAGDGHVFVSISTARIEETLRATPLSELPGAHPCAVTSTFTDKQGVNRVTTDCTAGSGYSYDVHELAEAMTNALSSGTIRADFFVRETPPTVVTASGQTLTLLASGRSTFKGSGAGRKANVRKGLNERLNNVWVPAETTFSFNAVLGSSISTAAGWQMALTIFNGKDLIAAPGGGICQVSTTLYRAALLAGFPIVKQKNHSLYVTYYEAHGVGQDATVFPGQQDFQFQNDTGNPLLIQSFTEGDEATVNIYGIPDGRETVITGPYFASTAPEDLLVNGRKMKKNEIVWVRTVKKGLSAAPEQELRVARYQAIPKSLAKKWEVTTVRNRPGEAVASAGGEDLVAGR